MAKRKKKAVRSQTGTNSGADSRAKAGKQETEEEKAAKRRNALKEKLDAFMEERSERSTGTMLDEACAAEDALTSTFREKLLVLSDRKDYMKLWKEYRKTDSSLTRLQKRQGSPEKEQELLAKRESIAKQMTDIHKNSDITENFCQEEMLRLCDGSSLPVGFPVSCAADVWKGVADILFGKGQMPKTPEKQYAADRTAHRQVTPRHVLVLEAKMSEEEKRKVCAMTTEARIVSNRLTGIMQQNLIALKGQKAYQELQQQYKKVADALSRLKEDQAGSEKETDLLNEKDVLAERMTAMQEDCGLTWGNCQKQMQEIGKDSIVPSVFLLSCAEDVWQGVEAVLFGDGTRLHFRRKGDNPVLRAKQIDRCLALKLKDDHLVFSVPLGATRETIRQKYAETLNALEKERGPGSVIPQWEKDTIKCNLKRTLRQNYAFGLKIKKKDLFAQDEIDRLKAFLADPDAERKAVETWKETGVPQNTFRPCYCSIGCETIRGRLRVWCYVTIEGTPCPKKDRNGNPRHHYGEGDMGVDLGPQCFEAVTQTDVFAGNLAERSGRSSFAFEGKEQELQRAMDRSRKANNPKNYRPDGTAIKGRRMKHCSNRYKRLKRRHQDLCRKNAVNRRYAINETVNRLRAAASRIIIEPSNVKAMQKRARAKEEQADSADSAAADAAVPEPAACPSVEKTSPRPSQQQCETAEKPDSGKETGEQKKKRGRGKGRRKRFGRSILHRCPGYFFARLKQVFESTGGMFCIVANMYRASQYDHRADVYIKKKLSERWHVFADGSMVQRDLYSAFLLMCALADLSAPDRKLCLKYFDEFLKHHNEFMEHYDTSKSHICNFGPRPKTAAV